MSAHAPSVLQRILAETRERVERAKREATPPPGTRAAPAGSGAGGSAEAAPERPPGAFRAALAAPGIGVIAEFKRRSPSAGALREGADLEQVLGAYERGGAAAISVLTEEPNFGGSIGDLRAARAGCALPLLRKDFIVDEWQLREARHAGADAVLLIVAALPQRELRRLHAASLGLGLDVLVEAHDRSELARALEAGARIVGINNRDLHDFSVDVGRTEQLLADVPPGVLVVSESGIGSPDQLARLAALGVHAVLVGETLMRAPDPAAALRALTARAAPRPLHDPTS